MPNVLGNYDEEMFAQLALEQLEKELGMAGRVHRGYDPTPRARGSQISIRRPSTFTAQEEPSSAQDLAPEDVNITLNFHWGTKIKLTDKDLSLSAEQVVTDHARPMAVAIADKIDQSLCGLYVDIPWISAQTSTPVIADLAAARKIMRDNRVPLNDESMLHYMMDSATELEFVKALSASPSLVTDPTSLRRGSIGRLFGFDSFANQNTPIHTSGVASDAAGAVDFGSGTTAVYAAGSTMVHIDGLESAGTFKIGDTFVFTDHTQRYTLTADATASSGEQDFHFSPPLKEAVDENEVVTFVMTGSAKAQTLAWHQNAFALAMAPLSTLGADVGGARMAVVSDPKTNLALRSRLFYVGNDSAVYMALDALWGVKTLNPNMAVRVYDV